MTEKPGKGHNQENLLVVLLLIIFEEGGGGRKGEGKGGEDRARNQDASRLERLSRCRGFSSFPMT